MRASSVGLAVTFATTSPFLSDPSSLASSHPTLHPLRYTKPVGELSDVLEFALPANGGTTKDVVEALKSVQGVLRVDMLEQRTRTKREEL